MSSRFRSIDSQDPASGEDEISIDLAQLEAELLASIARLKAVPVRSATPAPTPTPTPAPSPSPSPAPSATPTPVSGEVPLAPLDLPSPGRERREPSPLSATAATPSSPAPVSVKPAPPVALPPVAPAAPQKPTATGAGFDLLSELRQAAEEKTRTNQVVESERKARADSSERAMRALYRYLSEFAGHLNKIQPALPQVFRPLPNIELSGLRWTESFLDYRTSGGTEISPLDTITLRYSLSTGDQVHVDKLPNYAQAYLEELKRVGLRHTVTEKRGSKGLVEQFCFAIDRLVSINLHFKVVPDSMMIFLQARNFTGLGQSVYAVAVDQVDQALLDEFGKQILGRPNQLFQRLIKQP